jgi:glutathione S-transferase
VAYAGNFVRLRELAEEGKVRHDDYPYIVAWMERIGARVSFGAAG